MPKLTPVEHDPFSVTLTPVEHDPFSSSGEASWGNVVSSSVKTVKPSFKKAVGGAIQMVEDDGLYNSLVEYIKPLTNLIPIPQPLKESVGAKLSDTVKSAYNAGKKLVNPDGTATNLGKQIVDEANAEIEANTPSLKKGSAKYHLFNILSSVAQNLPQIAYGVITKNTALPLTAMGAQAGFQTYADQRKEGMTPETALKAGLIKGTSEALTEKLPFDALIKSGLSFAKRLVLVSGLDVPGEVINQMVSDAVDKTTVNPNLSFDEALENIKDTIIQSFGAAGIQTTLTHPLVKIGEKKSAVKLTPVEHDPFATPPIESRIEETPYETDKSPTEPRVDMGDAFNPESYPNMDKDLQLEAKQKAYEKFLMEQENYINRPLSENKYGFNEDAIVGYEAKSGKPIIDITKGVSKDEAYGKGTENAGRVGIERTESGLSDAAENAPDVSGKGNVLKGYEKGNEGKGQDVTGKGVSKTSPVLKPPEIDKALSGEEPITKPIISKKPKSVQQENVPRGTKPQNIVSWAIKKGGINGDVEHWKGELSLLKEDLNKGNKMGIGSVLIRKSGKTLDELALMAKDEGFISEATPDALIEALAGKKLRAQDAEALNEAKLANTINLSDLKKGDKFIKDGETFEHKGIDKEGNAVIKDGEVYKVDPFGQDVVLQVDKVIEGKPKVKPSQSDMFGAKGQALEGKLPSEEYAETPLERAKKEAEIRKTIEAEGKAQGTLPEKSSRASMTAPVEAKTAEPIPDKPKLLKTFKEGSKVEINGKGYEVLKHIRGIDGEIVMTNVRPLEGKEIKIKDKTFVKRPKPFDISGDSEVSNGGTAVTLESGGFQTAYEAIERAFKEGKPQKAYSDVVELGKSVYQSGAKTFKEFSASMKERLGDMWTAFKDRMLRAFLEVKAWNKRLGEEGGIGKRNQISEDVKKVVDFVKEKGEMPSNAWLEKVGLTQDEISEFHSAIGKLPSKKETKSITAAATRKVAQEAYKEGKKQVKEEVKEKTEEQKIDNAVKRITRIKKSMSVDFQRVVNGLKDGKKISSDAVNKLQQYLDNPDDIGMSETGASAISEQLQSIADKSYSAMTKNEKKIFAGVLKQLKAHDAYVRSVDLALKGHTIEQEQKRILASTSKLSAKEDVFRKGVKELYVKSLTGSRVANMLDGYTTKGTGVNEEYVFNQFITENNAEFQTKEQFADFLNKARAIKNEWTETETERIVVKALDIMGAETQRDVLMAELGIKEIPTLTSDENSLMSLIETTMNLNKEDIKTVFEGRENEIFPEIARYIFPLKYTAQRDSVNADILRHDYHRTKTADDYFTEQRTKGVKKLIRTDIFNVVFEGLAAQNWYSHMQPVLDAQAAVLFTKDYRAKAGELGYRWWKDQIDIVARRGYSAKSDTMFSDAAQTLKQARINLNKAVMAYKASSAAMQIFSTFDAMAYGVVIGKPSTLVTTPMYIAKNWLFKNPELYKMSKALQLRDGGEQAFKELAEKGFGSKWAEIGFKPLREADLRTALGTLESYHKMLGGTTESLNKAEVLMTLSQGGTSIALRPHVLASGELARTAFTFQTFFLNRWGLVAHDIINKSIIHGDARQKIRGANAIAIIIAASILEDDAREYLYSLITGKHYKDVTMGRRILAAIPETIPLVGRAISATIQGRLGDTDVPVLRMVKQGGRGLYDLAFNEEGAKKAQGALKALETLLSVKFGIAGTAQIFDIIERALPETKGQINQQKAYYNKKIAEALVRNDRAEVERLRQEAKEKNYKLSKASIRKHKRKLYEDEE